MTLTLVVTVVSACQRPLAPAPPVQQPPAPGGADPDPVAEATPEDEARVARVVYTGFDGFVSNALLAQLAEDAPLQEGEPRTRERVTATARRAVELLQDAG